MEGNRKNKSSTGGSVLGLAIAGLIGVGVGFIANTVMKS
jgi:hypothetical protein